MQVGGDTGSDYIVGRHVFANLYGVDKGKLWDEEYLRRLVEEAVKRARASLVELKSWRFGGRHGGVSVLALVIESHVAIHTWPEYGYATIDIYTCGERSDPWKAFEYMLGELKPRYYIVGYADRSSLYISRGAGVDGGSQEAKPLQEVEHHY